MTYGLVVSFASRTCKRSVWRGLCSSTVASRLRWVRLVLTVPTRSGSRWWWMGWCSASAGPLIELPGGRISGAWVAGCEDHRGPAVVPVAGLFGRDTHGSGLLQSGQRGDAGRAGAAILVFRLIGLLRLSGIAAGMHLSRSMTSMGQPWKPLRSRQSRHW